jgi:hypothetical protein
VRHTRIVVTHYGGPDALQVLEEECPEPKRGEVRVKVLAAGVPLPDLMMRVGVHPETPLLPFTPGWDLVGTVDRLGGGVSGIEPGQIVAALPISGAYAEFVCLRIWSRPDRSATKAAQAIRQHARQLAGALRSVRWLCQAIRTLIACLRVGCRMNQRRASPNLYQLLLELVPDD